MSPKAAAPSVRTRPGSIRRWRRPVFIPIGSPEFPSAQSIRPSSPAIHRKGGSTGCGSSGDREHVAGRNSLFQIGRVARQTEPYDHQPGARHECAAVRRAQFLRPAHAAGHAVARRPRPRRATTTLRHCGRRSSAWSISISSITGVSRFSVGAVDVCNGNFTYFDSTTHRIRVEHVMASGSLPPGFPATEIDGEFFWDGGIISNTPLQWVSTFVPGADTLAFQIDLWNAPGMLPGDLFEAEVRHKDIVFSSRTRERHRSVASPAQRLRRLFRHVFYEQLARRSSCIALKLCFSPGNPTNPSTTSCISSITRRITRARRRITSSRGAPWKSIGAPAIVPPDARRSVPPRSAAQTRTIVSKVFRRVRFSSPAFPDS